MNKPILHRCAPRPGKGGWTLIETLIASALFLVVGLIIATMFQWGLTSSAIGKMGNDAQAQARTAMKRMKDELQQSIRLGCTMPMGTSAMASSVLRPSTEVSGSYNDLMFVVAYRDINEFKSPQSLGLDPRNIANYCLIRYSVDANGRVLRRQTWRMAANNATPLPMAYGATEPTPSSPPTPAALATPMPALSVAPAGTVHWYVDAAQVGNLGATLSDDEIVSLPANSDDFIQFTVTHDKNPSTSTIAGTFDPLTYRIDIQIVRYYQLDKKTPARSRGAARYLVETVAVPDFSRS